MSLLVIEARPGRMFHSGEERYFLLKFEGALHAVPDACAHRGGPLSKGAQGDCKGSIVCPMHQLRTSAKSLLAKALPALRVGDKITVVSPAPAEA